MRSQKREVPVDIHKIARAGIIICLVVFGVFGLWSGFAPIDGAARAPGVVSVKSYKKVVQHLEGGIVSEIMVRNGDRVSIGDVLLILDDTQPVAQLGVTQTQFVALKALESRLLAERDGLPEIVFPESLQVTESGVAEEVATQSSIFDSRRNTHEGSLQVLRQRIEQLQARLVGLKALRVSKESLASSFLEEVNDNRTLLKQGFADKTRLRELERNHAQLTGEAANLMASISSTEIEIGEARLQLLQEQNEFHSNVVTELGETRTRLRDITERKNALHDIVSRTTIRSPESGVVNNLLYHTIGAVIEPGALIADIVPLKDDLIIEARVSPLDIDRVTQGQEATVRFSSFSAGAIPTIDGSVLSLSADSLVDQNTGASYYLARIEVSSGSLSGLGDLSLIPGMPAEVFIATGSRTFLQYLGKPLTNALARSFRED